MLFRSTWLAITFCVHSIINFDSCDTWKTRTIIIPFNNHTKQPSPTSTYPTHSGSHEWRTSVVVNRRHLLSPTPHIISQRKSLTTINVIMLSSSIIQLHETIDEDDHEEELVERRKCVIKSSWRAVQFGLDAKATEIFYTEIGRAHV